jgi:hypothetical protein
VKEHDMKTLLRIIGGLILVGIVALLGLVFIPIQRTAALTDVPANYEPKGAGEQVAIAADCMACHTAPGGKPFAGGRVIDSPSEKSIRATSRPTRRPALAATRSTISAPRSTTE